MQNPQSYINMVVTLWKYMLWHYYMQVVGKVDALVWKFLCAETGSYSVVCELHIILQLIMYGTHVLYTCSRKVMLGRIFFNFACMG